MQTRILVWTVIEIKAHWLNVVLIWLVESKRVIRPATERIYTSYHNTHYTKYHRITIVTRYYCVVWYYIVVMCPYSVDDSRRVHGIGVLINTIELRSINRASQIHRNGNYSACAEYRYPRINVYGFIARTRNYVHVTCIIVRTRARWQCAWARGRKPHTTSLFSTAAHFPWRKGAILNRSEFRMDMNNVISESLRDRSGAEKFH